MKKNTLAILLCLTSFACLSPCFAAGGNRSMSIPDFTNGDPIPANAKKDWNLGPTGLRGWIYSDKMMTTDARQIKVTQVQNGSPADGVIAAGDVILGVAGKMFTKEPRSEFGIAITQAESTAGGGKLVVTRWREGKSEEVEIKLPVKGDYASTAPFACEKSKRIFEEGCKILAKKIESNADRNDPIVRSINALALLASGDPQYLPLLKKEAQWAADLQGDGFQTWRYGYTMLFLSEYILLTQDRSVLPGLRRLALEAAKSQSAVGSWGHRFAKPDGRLFGYGMMNSPGIPLTISLILAKRAGVNDAAVTKSIDLSAKLLRFYIGKGAIPYGDHDVWIENHDDNGKCGMAAVLFQLLGEKPGAEFFSHMSVACYGAERDTGHTGNYFNILWAVPGVAQSGAQATGAWMKEYGSWYFDLARQADGSFVHQGPPEPDFDSYRGWDSTGAILLAYAMPLKKLYLTGKGRNLATQIDAEKAQSLINDGRGWSNKHRDFAYGQLSDEDLLSALSSWSPVVRERSASALAKRKAPPVDAVVALLSSKNRESQLGACQAICHIGQRAAAAVDPLLVLLEQKDLWLRIKAAEALTAIGAPSKRAIPRLLKMMVEVDLKNDPRGMLQRYLCFHLFTGRGILGSDFQGVDKQALDAAIRMGLQNQDGRARSSVSSIYQKLTYEQIRPLLPFVMDAITKPAPSGEMFADEVRIEGLRIMAKHKIREGMAACVTYTRDQNQWASEKRTGEIMKILLTYGAHAKPLIPEMEKIANYFEKDEPDFPKHLMIQKAKCVRDTIAAIEASTEKPDLIPLR